MRETTGKTISDRKFLSGLLGLGLLALSTCGGGSSSSGPPPPLPNGQTGSIVAAALAPANCYISDVKTSCNTSTNTSTTGTNPITALAAATIGSTGTTNVLYWGDGGGNIESLSSPSSTLPSSSSSFKSCLSGTSSTPITSLAVVPSPTPLLFYTTSGGDF